MDKLQWMVVMVEFSTSDLERNENHTKYSPHHHYELQIKMMRG